LILRKGPGNNIGVVGPIADSIPDSGSYEWAIPTNLVPGSDYAVQIIVGPAANVSNVGPDGYNFTPLLTLVNNSTSFSNTTTTASSAESISTTASSAAVSSGASTSTIAGVTTTLSTTKGTATGGSSATGTTQSASSTATHASSAARVEGALMSGHGLFALVIAVAVGIVASF
jgi:hypothetical protein